MAAQDVFDTLNLLRLIGFWHYDAYKSLRLCSGRFFRDSNTVNHKKMYRSALIKVVAWADFEVEGMEREEEWDEDREQIMRFDVEFGYVEDAKYTEPSPERHRVVQELPEFLDPFKQDPIIIITRTEYEGQICEGEVELVTVMEVLRHNNLPHGRECHITINNRTVTQWYEGKKHGPVRGYTDCVAVGTALVEPTLYLEGQYKEDLKEGVWINRARKYGVFQSPEQGFHITQTTYKADKKNGLYTVNDRGYLTSLYYTDDELSLDVTHSKSYSDGKPFITLIMTERGSQMTVLGPTGSVFIQYSRTLEYDECVAEQCSFINPLGQLLYQRQRNGNITNINVYHSEGAQGIPGVPDRLHQVLQFHGNHMSGQNVAYRRDEIFVAHFENSRFEGPLTVYKNGQMIFTESLLLYATGQYDISAEQYMLRSEHRYVRLAPYLFGSKPLGIREILDVDALNSFIKIFKINIYDQNLYLHYAQRYTEQKFNVEATLQQHHYTEQQPATIVFEIVD
jgi:hypothetical protein